MYTDRTEISLVVHRVELGEAFSESLDGGDVFKAEMSRYMCGEALA